MKAYKYIQVLSLDVVIGACISMLYLAKLFGTSIPPVTVVALAICVWLIYTADHLWDARKNDLPSTFRHAFHQNNFKILGIVWIIVAVAGVVLLFYLPIVVIKYGAILLSTVFIYFILLYTLSAKKIMHKEVSIAFIYTAGIFVTPLALSAHNPSFSWEWVFLIFFILALINVLLFALYEESIDKQDGHNSVIMVIGSTAVLNLAKILWLSGIIILVVIGRDISLYYVFVLMFLCLGSLFVFRDFFSQNERYRIIGDGIFILPVIPLLL